MDEALIERLRSHLNHPKEKITLQIVEKTLTPKDIYFKKGIEALKKGEVATVVLAGGMGTRLKFPYPKGLYPISSVRKKTLFQLIAEKTLAASKAYGKELPLAFMTSHQNHDETIAYFKEHADFGIHPLFFTQEDLPLLDKSGNPIKHGVDYVKGPDGNGRMFEHLMKASILEKWEKQGIKYINVILIDNPLADPFDPILIGALIETKDEVIFKAVKKETPDEKTGTFVKANGRLKVVEYTEMEESEKSLHPYASISLFAVTLPFAKKIAAAVFPLHVALKPALPSSKDPDSFKFETFIFDLLDFSEIADILIYSREEAFAPLKNSIGNDSPTSVGRALENLDRRVLSQITGHRITNQPLELDAQFHYPTKQLIERWKNREVDPFLHYIHEDQ